MENQPNNNKKQTIIIQYKQTSITFSGNFDSGNLNSASLDLEKDEINVTFGKDKDIKPSSKTWFYFSIRSQQELNQLKLCLLRVNTLTAASKIFDFYRPVIRQEDGEWDRHDSPVEFETTCDNQINMRFSLKIKAKKLYEVALIYPWSFSQNQKYLQNLQEKMKLKQDIYFNKQTLTQSVQGRPIHIIAISSAQCQKYPQQKILEGLFPKIQQQSHFKEIHKPLILITSRVHPGEVGSSYSLAGMLQLLCSEQGAQLRNQFYFLIIPMLNPDGVFVGNNRMDTLGQNLNRFYHLPDKLLQPSCYAVKALVQYFKRDIYAFFDLHGHANKKSCFLFGNWINNPRKQAESVLFARHFSTYNQNLQFRTCNFSKKQMASRDKNEDMSKQGCARVVVYKWTQSPYCFTLQTGLYKDVKQDQKGVFRYGQKFYNPSIYRQLGRQMLLSLFALTTKNKELDNMRKFCQQYVIKMDKPIKKQKTKVQKAEKAIKSLAAISTNEQYPPQSWSLKQGFDEKNDESQQRTQQQPLCELQNQSKKQLLKNVNERGKQVSNMLRKNKLKLINLNQDDDDE